VDLRQSLNGVVQGRHHLHLELEELLRGQWWRHRQRLTAADQYPGCSAPAGQNRNRCAWCSPSDGNKRNFMRKDMVQLRE
jgi:hypothetical protein